MGGHAQTEQPGQIILACGEVALDGALITLACSVESEFFERFNQMRDCEC